VIGARDHGFAIIERLLADGWDGAGGAVSADTVDRVRLVASKPERSRSAAPASTSRARWLE